MKSISPLFGALACVLVSQVSSQCDYATDIFLPNNVGALYDVRSIASSTNFEVDDPGNMVETWAYQSLVNMSRGPGLQESMHHCLSVAMVQTDGGFPQFTRRLPTFLGSQYLVYVDAYAEFENGAIFAGAFQFSASPGVSLVRASNEANPRGNDPGEKFGAYNLHHTSMNSQCVIFDTYNGMQVPISMSKMCFTFSRNPALQSEEEVVFLDMGVKITDLKFPNTVGGLSADFYLLHDLDYLDDPGKGPGEGTSAKQTKPKPRRPSKMDKLKKIDH